MIFRRFIVISTLVFLLGCSPGNDYSLDRSIPGLQSPDGQIGYIRTKYRNDKPIETAFFDHQNRMLENFIFGISNSKVLNTYIGNLLNTTIRYEHSDSSEPGYVSIDTLKRRYDLQGRLVRDTHIYGAISESGPAG